MEKRYGTYSTGKHELVVERKEIKRIKGKLVFVFIFAIVNVSLLLFLRSPHFSIEEISIKGLDKVSTEEILLAVGISEGMNIWKINPPDMRGKILDIPRVADVEIERVLPQKLAIHIREKYPLALVPYHGYYLELSQDSVFIGIRDHYEGELPLVSGLMWGRMDVGDVIRDQVRREIIDIFLEVMEGQSFIPLAEINVSNPDNVKVYTREGLEVWLGGVEEMAKKLEVLQQIYYRLPEAEPEVTDGYLDLRVPEAPTFRVNKK